MFIDLGDCGCEGRKETLDSWVPGMGALVEAIILGTPFGILVYLWLRKQTNS